MQASRLYIIGGNCDVDKLFDGKLGVLAHGGGIKC